jgi:hypothetical protein
MSNTLCPAPVQNCTGMQDSSWARCPLGRRSNFYIFLYACIKLVNKIWPELPNYQLQGQAFVITVVNFQVLKQREYLFELDKYFAQGRPKSWLVKGTCCFIWKEWSDPENLLEQRSTVVWDVTPFSPVGLHRRFGGTYCLYLQGQTVSQASSQQDAGSKQSDRYCRWICIGLHRVSMLPASCFNPEDGSGIFLRSVGELIPDYTLHSDRCENLKSFIRLVLLLSRFGNVNQLLNIRLLSKRTRRDVVTSHSYKSLSYILFCDKSNQPQERAMWVSRHLGFYAHVSPQTPFCRSLQILPFSKCNKK